MPEDKSNAHYEYTLSSAAVKSAGNKSIEPSENTETKTVTVLHAGEQLEKNQTASPVAQTAENTGNYTWEIMPEPRRRRIKFTRRRIRRLVFSTLLILIAFTAVATAFIVEKKPAVPVHGKAKITGLELLVQKFNSFDNASTLRVELTEDELNDFLPGVFDLVNSGYPEELQVNGKWRNGQFAGETSIKKFGVYFNTRFTAVPRWENGRLAFDITSAKLGKIPVPGFLRDLVGKRILADLEANNDYQQLIKGVSGIAVLPNHSLCLTVNNDLPPAPDYTTNPVPDCDKFNEILFTRLLTPLETAKNKQKEFFTAQLSNSNVNILFANIIGNFWESSRQADDPAIYAILEKEYLNIYATLTNGKGVPVIINLAIAPEIRDGRVFVRVSKFKAGQLQLPAALLERPLQKQLTGKADKEGYNRIMDICSLQEAPFDIVKEEILAMVKTVVRNLHFDTNGQLTVEASTDQMQELASGLL